MSQNKRSTEAFLKVPLNFISGAMRDMTADELKLLLLVSSQSFKRNGCDLTIKELGDRLDRHESQVRRALKKLEAKHLIHTFAKGWSGKRSKRVGAFAEVEVNQRVAEILSGYSQQNMPINNHNLYPQPATISSNFPQQFVAPSIRTVFIEEEMNRCDVEPDPASHPLTSNSTYQDHDAGRRLHPNQNSCLIPVTQPQMSMNSVTTNQYGHGTQTPSNYPQSSCEIAHLTDPINSRSYQQPPLVPASTSQNSGQWSPPPSQTPVSLMPSSHIKLPSLSQLPEATQRQVLSSPENLLLFICYGPLGVMKPELPRFPTKFDFISNNKVNASGSLMTPPSTFEALAGFWAWRMAIFAVAHGQKPKYSASVYLNSGLEAGFIPEYLYHLLVVFEKRFELIRRDLATMKVPFLITLDDASNLKNRFLLNMIESISHMNDCQIERFEQRVESKEAEAHYQWDH